MRNVAYMKKIFHSSAFDKNTAGHLVTSGVKGEPIPYGFDICDEYNDALESVWNIIDDQSRTRWVSTHSNTFFEIKFHKPVCAKGYRLMTNMFERELNPKRWQLSASVDGKVYTELDTNIAWMAAENDTRNMGYFYLHKEPL